MQRDDFKLKGIFTFTLRDIETGAERVITKENLIMTGGRAYVMARLMADQSPAGQKITHTALGTGTTAPAVADTQLQAEVFRKATASATNTANVGYLSAYYTATETTGTYREVGLFINGTGTANSGTLFSRVAVNITKSSSETLTVDYQLTLS